MTKVSTSVALPVKIERYLTSIHVPFEAAGISFYFNEEKPRPRRFLWWNWINRDEYYCVAKLFIGTLDKTSEYQWSKKWNLKVWGKEYLEQMEELAAKLAEHFQVEVHVCLESDTPWRLSRDLSQDYQD